MSRHMAGESGCFRCGRPVAVFVCVPGRAESKLPERKGEPVCGRSGTVPAACFEEGAEAVKEPLRLERHGRFCMHPETVCTGWSGFAAFAALTHEETAGDGGRGCVDCPRTQQKGDGGFFFRGPCPARRRAGRAGRKSDGLFPLPVHAAEGAAFCPQPVVSRN